MTSILNTDGYKFSMAQAGFPLREETFYLSFRRGGWHFNPFDLEAEVRNLLPGAPSPQQYEYLAAHNYRLTEGMRRALEMPIEVRAIPQGTWFGDQEPILTVTGPSFLVSWLEAQLTWLNYPIQLATELLRTANDADAPAIQVICPEHEAIVQRVMHAVEVSRPITRTQNYESLVLDAARHITQSITEGAMGTRVIEGGMRSALCMAHHRMVLAACREVGITRTSNVALAEELDLIPSGTAGHEHSQRSGPDPIAYRNYMDRVCGLVSCLSDTVSTLHSGLPATVDIAAQNPERDFLFRLDSGDRLSYFHISAARFRERGVENVTINVAGDVNADVIANFEPLRRMIDWPADRLSYMIGGQLTAGTLPAALTRSRVASVFKLSQTGGRPTMKQGDDVGIGKRSVPGHPVVWRRLRGQGPVGIIGQLGEHVPDNYTLLNGNAEASETLSLVRAAPELQEGRFIWGEDPKPYALSPATTALQQQLQADMRVP